jgi:hypothetical protein
MHPLQQGENSKASVARRKVGINVHLLDSSAVVSHQTDRSAMASSVKTWDFFVSTAYARHPLMILSSLEPQSQTSPCNEQLRGEIVADQDLLPAKAVVKFFNAFSPALKKVVPLTSLKL